MSDLHLFDTQTICNADIETQLLNVLWWCGKGPCRSGCKHSHTCITWRVKRARATQETHGKRAISCSAIWTRRALVVYKGWTKIREQLGSVNKEVEWLWNRWRITWGWILFEYANMRRVLGLVWCVIWVFLHSTPVEEAPVEVWRVWANKTYRTRGSFVTHNPVSRCVLLSICLL